MYEVFIPRKAQARTRELIEQAHAIIKEYMAQGYTLTLRQLHYQFVARGLYENTPQNYRRLMNTMRDGRDSGDIDWEGIEDRSRTRRTPTTWSDPRQIINVAAETYQEDPWDSQVYRPEVWIEKESLAGVIDDVCREYRVTSYAHTGYPSISDLYAAGKRLASYLPKQVPIVLALGDHDPEGIDITRNIKRRLDLYSGDGIEPGQEEIYSIEPGDIEVQRLGLTMEQVRRYRLPPNFAKETSTRFEGYEREFRTNKCWELDALPPPVLVGLIRDQLDLLIDRVKWEKALKAEERNRSKLVTMARKWS
jgi:hypothetical protein